MTRRKRSLLRFLLAAAVLLGCVWYFLDWVEGPASPAIEGAGETGEDSARDPMFTPAFRSSPRPPPIMETRLVFIKLVSPRGTSGG